MHVDRLAPCHTPTPTITPVHTNTPLNTSDSTQPYFTNSEQVTTAQPPQTFDTPRFSQDDQHSEAQDPYSHYTPSFDTTTTTTTTPKVYRHVSKRNPPSYLSSYV